MKTAAYIDRKDIIAFIAVISLFAIMMPLKAETGKNESSENDTSLGSGVALFDSVQPVPISLQFQAGR